LDEASFQVEIDEIILEKVKMRSHMQKEASRSHGCSLLAPAGPSVTDKSRVSKMMKMLGQMRRRRNVLTQGHQNGDVTMTEAPTLCSVSTQTDLCPDQELMERLLASHEHLLNFKARGRSHAQPPLRQLFAMTLMVKISQRAVVFVMTVVINHFKLSFYLDPMSARSVLRCGL